MLAVVPARAGSKGIPNKNIFPLCDKPLIEYTLNAIKNSDLEEYIISSDCDKIIKEYEALRRPKDLSQGEKGSIIKVMKYIAEIFPNEDDFMILQPTSPLRISDDINKAMQIYYERCADSLYSGYKLKYKTKNKLYDKSENKYHFQRNSAIFICHRYVIEEGKIWTDDVIEFEMPESRSIDIDDLHDMHFAECLIKGGILNNGNIVNNNINIGIYH
jgi:CMP-N-acetylneuraminic acid synthetase